METNKLQVTILKENIFSILKYCQNNDLLNIELTNKYFKSKVDDYYKKMLNQNNSDIILKNTFEYKKKYLDSYYNELRIFNFNNIAFDSTFKQESYDLKINKETLLPKNDIFNFLDFSHIHAHEDHFKEIIYCNNIIKQIMIYDDYIIILYNGNIMKVINVNLSNEIKVFEIDIEEETIKFVYNQEFKLLILFTGGINLYYININSLDKINPQILSIIDFETKEFLKVDEVFIIKGYFITYNNDKNLIYLTKYENLLSLISYKIDQGRISNNKEFSIES